MARDPGSVWAPLPENAGAASYAKDKFIVHSTGTRATAAANYRYFASAAVAVESTFIVGLSAADPTLQILDSAAKADANGDANRSAISVEVVGEGGDPFTTWQINELTRLGRWAHDVHRIPLRLIPSPAAGGYGWHVMFGAPGPWTTVRGKVCPGTTRIRQLHAAVFPAVFADSPTDAALTEEDDVLTAHQENQLNGIVENSGEARRLAAQARDEGRTTAAQVAALQALVTRALAGDDLDVAAILAAAKEGAAQALDERIAAAEVSLTVDPAPA